ncbi:MAG: DUF2442 domain-containing protein [bacterium]
MVAAQEVSFTDDALIVEMSDGRILSVPLVWFPRLLHATPEQRQNWELLGGGEGIHWPEVDEDISVEGLLQGIPSVEARKTTATH